LALPLLEGLDAIHQAGFLHRDIKPSNIVLRSEDNSPVLLDFGSARSAVTTQTLTAIVSPGYGPIEQYFDQGTQGAWSDIYSMAAVLYRIVTGRPPVPAPQRASKDSLLPAVFAGRGRFSEPFLKALDQALKVDETKRPQCVADWRRLLANPSLEPGNCVGVLALTSAELLDAGKNIGSVDEAPTLNGTGLAPSVAASIDDCGSLNAELAKAMPTTADARSSHVSPPNPRIQRLWRTITRHPLRVSAGLVGAFIVAVLSVVPTNDIGAMLRNTPDYVELRFFHFMYSSEIRSHNVKAAYEFWTPESEENISSLPSLLKDPHEGGRYQNLLALTNTTAILLTTSVIDGKASGPIAQTWVKLENGNWYRDRLNDYMAFKDRQRREEKLAVNKQAQFSIEDSTTEWTFLEDKTQANRLMARPVTTFRIKNQGTTPISALYIKAEYVDRATNKPLTKVEWSVVDGNDVLPPGAISRRVISGSNDGDAFAMSKAAIANRGEETSIDIQYFYRLDKLSPWEKIFINAKSSKKVTTKTTH
jgi:serine/threonine protein kinase